MELYSNKSKKSNIEAYEIKEHSIIVKFKSGQWQYYLYDYNNPGVTCVENMKKLAMLGEGLNSYITKEIKKNFSNKW